MPIRKTGRRFPPVSCIRNARVGFSWLTYAVTVEPVEYRLATASASSLRPNRFSGPG